MDYKKEIARKTRILNRVIGLGLVAAAAAMLWRLWPEVSKLIH